jgi:hypothetical protein
MTTLVFSCRVSPCDDGDNWYEIKEIAERPLKQEYLESEVGGQTLPRVSLLDAELSWVSVLLLAGFRGNGYFPVVWR